MPKIAGAAEHIARLKRPLSPQGADLLAASLFEMGNKVEVDAANSITEGAVSGAGHIPSKPGEPPSADTHVLDRAIETNQITKLKVEVSSNAPYAAALEFGTSRIAPRPYMAPALQKNKERITQRLAQTINIINRRGG